MTVLIETSDRKTVIAEDILINNSLLLKNIIEDTDMTDGVIPINNISYEIFHKIMDCVKSEDKQHYLDTLDKETIIEFVIALNFLNIEWLMTQTCKTIALRIKGMSLEDVKEYLSID